MREIKYQVYIEDGYIDGKPAAIYPVSGLEFDSEGKLLRVSFWPTNAPWNRTLESVKLREYTGLKDRNGVEIYEGDVLNLMPEGYSGDYAVVEWNEGESCWWYRRTYNQQGIYVKWKPVEVIGNKYQNPELLTT